MRVYSGNEVGIFSKDEGKFQMDNGHLCATFKNSKLSIIARRGRHASAAELLVTDKKYALLIYTDQFDMENVGSFQLWVSIFILFLIYFYTSAYPVPSERHPLAAGNTAGLKSSHGFPNFP